MLSANESNAQLARLSGMRSLAAILLLLLVVPASHVEARAMCVGRHCGDLDIMPPIPPTPPDGPPVPRAGLPFSSIAPRVRALQAHVEECASTHLDDVPRNVSMRVTVQPDGRWGLSFGRAQPTEIEERGHTPFEVCVADWVSSELGPRVEPLASRRPRNVVVRYRLANFTAR